MIKELDDNFRWQGSISGEGREQHVLPGLQLEAGGGLQQRLKELTLKCAWRCLQRPVSPAFTGGDLFAFVSSDFQGLFSAAGELLTCSTLRALSWKSFILS